MRVTLSPAALRNAPTCASSSAVTPALAVGASRSACRVGMEGPVTRSLRAWRAVGPQSQQDAEVSLDLQSALAGSGAVEPARDQPEDQLARPAQQQVGALGWPGARTHAAARDLERGWLLARVQLDRRRRARGQLVGGEHLREHSDPVAAKG